MLFDKSIEGIYATLGLIKNGQGQPLHSVCEYANNCWDGSENRKPTGNNITWSYISAPWIGAKFNETRIVVLGINANEGGGLNFYREIIIPEARQGLQGGQVKINFNHPGYKGTLLFHRIGAYVSEIISSMQNLKPPPNTIPYKKIEIYDAYEHMSFLNQIKCSPVGQVSKPTPQMWATCGKHILLRELQVLAPKFLTIF